MATATKRGHSKEAVALRREMFVRAYISNGHNAAQAWIAAGGSKASARQNAYEVLQEPGVKERIARLTAKALEVADITAQRTMIELGRVAFSDLRDCFDADGKLLPVHELSADAAAAIAGFEVEITETTKGDVTTRVAKIRRAGKEVALGLLARHHKLVGNELDETLGKAMQFGERLGRARERLRRHEQGKK